MKKMYAPWRTPYIKKDHDVNNLDQGCVFCTTLKSDSDDKNFVLKRGKNCFVILNLYPYNAGHLLVLPNQHTGSLNELSPETRAEMMELTNQASEALQITLKAQGVNVGLNLGEVAGGGIPDHVHMHVLPRWPHDTNFMPLLANTKMISTDLDEVYSLLKESFKK